jgi:pimeloyl-ACP methyl ester carboxylesterase
VVADCPFASFDEIANERLAQVSGLPQFAFWPIVRLGFAYTRIADGLDLRRASPAAVIRTTDVPVLLIHGSADSNIPPHHSVELHALNPSSTRLWIVPGAGHVASLTTTPQIYARTVVAWFHAHQ